MTTTTNSTRLICTVCPKGCRLRVTEHGGELRVSGHGCPRGETYGKIEVANPTRVLTSTVCLFGGLHPRCPVKTQQPIPKYLTRVAARALDGICLSAPVEQGQIVLENICDTGVAVVATRTMNPVWEPETREARIDDAAKSAGAV